MALPTSGAISLNQIHVEAGGTSGTQASINDSDIRGLISKASGAQMSFSEWYGASGGATLSIASAFAVSSNDTSDTVTCTATGLNTTGPYNLQTPNPTASSGSLLCEFSSFFYSMSHDGGGTWSVNVRLDRTGSTSGVGSSTFEVKAGFSSLSPALTATANVLQSS